MPRQALNYSVFFIALSGVCSKLIEDPTCRALAEGCSHGDQGAVAAAVEAAVTLDGTGRIGALHRLTTVDAGDTDLAAFLGRAMLLAQTVTQLGQQRIVCDLRQILDVDLMCQTFATGRA